MRATDEERKAIGGWLREGLSASEMAELLSRLRGEPVSRNAVVGIVHRNAELKRIGFARQGHGGGGNFGGRKQQARAGRPAGTKPAAKPADKPAARPHPGNIAAKKEARLTDLGSAGLPVPALSATQFDAASRRIPLEALEWRDCRFPVNAPEPGGTILFCGLPRAGEASYCAAHCARAFAGFPARRAA